MAKTGLRVECYSGYRGEQEPRRIHFGAREVDVTEILDRWLAPDHRYFRLLGSDGDTYILRHDVRDQGWSLAFYRRGSEAMGDRAPHRGLSTIKPEASA